MEEWSRGVMIITSALNILNLPLGSMLGGYGLWVLLTPETDPLFAREPLHRVPNKGVAQGNTGAGDVEESRKKSATRPTIIPSPRS
jgi:hypothetical protein